jgi:hypothetical protein
MTDKEQKLSDLLKRLSAVQLDYVRMRMECNTATEAANALGIGRDTVYHWPAEVEQAIVLAKMDSVMMAQEILRRSTPEAAEVKCSGMRSRDEKIRQASATEILDRQLGKPMQSMSGDVGIRLIYDLPVPQIGDSEE